MISPNTPITSENAAFAFYDIESLADVFTLSIYLPRRPGNRGPIVYCFHLREPGSALAAEVFDTVRAEEEVRRANPAMDPSTEVRFHDLLTWEANDRLAQMLGLSDSKNVNDPQAPSSYGSRYRLVCDTDDGIYDPFEAHPFLCGYNSSNYDTTMLALYLWEAFRTVVPAVARGLSPETAFVPTSPARLRGYNDDLFSGQYIGYMPAYLTEGPVASGEGWDSVPHRIRQAMLNSGRHIDAARFVEMQHSGLKRVLGGLGRQILESDLLGGHNASLSQQEDPMGTLLGLLAYNVSDDVGLSQLFQDPAYSSNFDLKRGLMAEYPEVVYDRKKGTHTPDINPKSVRRNRLTPDSTSAKFVGLILAPYAPLDDLEFVSFMYPNEERAKEMGLEPFDVLDYSREFFHATITDPDARARFQEVYDYYDSIRGKNFNSSDHYKEIWGDSYTGPRAPHILKEIPKRPMNLPYFDADGQPTSCFAAFSFGGIHGAEANVGKWKADNELAASHEAMLALAKEVFPDPLDFRTEAKRQFESLRLPDGSVVEKAKVVSGKKWRKPNPDDPEQSEQLQRAQAQLDDPLQLLDTQRPKTEELDVYLKDGRRIEGKVVLDKKTLSGATYREHTTKKTAPLFKPTADGSTILEKKYTYTSIGHVIHEDFTSYYPNLLRNMGAFSNPQLGQDRYAKIFEDKERFGRMMKDPSTPAAERSRLKVLREGTKLILNTASGAGDMPFGKSPIRMNNTIISMRLIGQLYTWMVGQAQTTAGAKIVSTNTDGLYSELDDETNNRVLAEMAKRIGVEIEPEPMVIVSKDSNSRLELAPPKDQPDAPVHEWDIVSASGGTLVCHEGPIPAKNLTHAAVLHWAMARYLRYIAGDWTPPHMDRPLSMDDELDIRTAKLLLVEAQLSEDPVMASRLFQVIVAASTGKLTFPFTADPMTEDGEIRNPQPLGHYTRVFIVRPGTPGAQSLHAAGSWSVPPASRIRRAKLIESGEDHRSVYIDTQVALPIMRANGYSNKAADLKAGHNPLPADQDVAVHRITGLDPSLSVIVDNRDLHTLPQAEIAERLATLDLDAYAQMLAKTFNENWRRRSAETADTAESIDDEEE